jgi:murein DD-endopeptidase MepM/ murein hydrolase activator NlpD
MRILRRLLIVRWAIYAILLSGVGTWALTSTEPGLYAWRLANGLAEGYARTTPDATAGLADAELGIGLSSQRAVAAITAESAGIFTDQASALAFAGAASLPDPEELAAALEGWQSDLLAYEAELRASMPDGATAADIEARMDELFRPKTVARRIEPAPAPAPVPEPEAAPAPEPETPAAVEPEPAPEAEAAVEPQPEAAPPPSPAPTATVRTVGFEPHPAFYKCPVIEVSNSGRVDAELTLLDYTPWVDTPAGVLIRAPVAGACLSSGYGTRQVEGASRNHAGVDYYNRDGGEIFAAGDGTVTEAGEDAAYGFSVRIDHGGGVESHYAHMVPGSLKVRAGERVSLGQAIGIMGRSGRAYAVHLHYELRFDEATVDPLYQGKRASF